MESRKYGLSSTVRVPPELDRWRRDNKYKLQQILEYGFRILRSGKDPWKIEVQIDRLIEKVAEKQRIIDQQSRNIEILAQKISGLNGGK